MPVFYEDDVTKTPMKDSDNKKEAPATKIGKIFELIPLIKGQLEAVKRSQVNSAQKFRYRGIDDLYNALCELEAKHGVFSVPVVESETHSEKPSRSGGMMTHTILRVRYRFYAHDSSYLDAVVVGEGMDSGDKSCNKAMSIAHKYALTQIYCVRTEDQQDPDSESPELGHKANNLTNRAPATPTGKPSVAPNFRDRFPPAAPIERRPVPTPPVDRTPK